MAVTYTAIMILVCLVIILIKSFTKINMSHPQPYRQCNKPNVAVQLLHNMHPTLKNFFPPHDQNSTSE